MHKTRVKSFTLTEMLVVMIITAIVVGMAFSILTLVQKQVLQIKDNFSKKTELALFEHQIWLDISDHNTIIKNQQELKMINDIDTVTYIFDEQFVIRQSDTVKLAIVPQKNFLNDKEVSLGRVDALLFSADTEIKGYQFFVYSKPDATHYIN